ncbi:9092_t:CDS:2, partial [Funneliformis geosporum]
PFWDRAHDTELIIDICDGLRPPTDDIVAPEDYIELMKECWDPDPNKRPIAHDTNITKFTCLSPGTKKKRTVENEVYNAVGTRILQQIQK